MMYESEGNNLSILAEFTALAGSLQGSNLNEDVRLKASAVTRSLLSALELPFERIMQDVVMNPPTLMAIRMGVQLEIFTQVSQNPEGITLQTIVEKTGASPILVDHQTAKDNIICADNMISPQSPDSAASMCCRVCQAARCTDIQALSFDYGNGRSNGGSNNLSLNKLVLILETSAPPKLQSSFAKNNNHVLSSVKDTPFQLGCNTEFSYFEWLGKNPDLARDFHQWMTLKQNATPSWLDWFDIENHLAEDFNAEASDVLFVDVGGGEGQYVQGLKEKFPDAPGRLILQDLPQVISAVDSPPTSVELASHDFFTAQPIKDARAYFMHWTLHDWPDEQFQSILRHIVDVMEPEYSNLIIHETIIPDTNCDLPSACMSVMMIIQVAGFERSEKQWRELLESVGLSKVVFHQPPISGEGIIEAMK
ncbi:O-methyltransferase family 2 [Penicillium malachiteum]|uniref:O-methyltransferase family 2 n=1 Tax=Penicillium malachiteum TaxID=1324776 RepID=UPI002547DBC7|nr:O-methyltransferase family 2 [Penicillium malachiteum]KAJ5736388.1 O-methyltransferase family 2 [Penicillium malachiteum]